jgi:hypothetical protein
MFEKKYFSAHNDFKTGILFKLALFLGFILLIIFIILRTLSFVINEDNFLYFLSNSKYVDITGAFALLILFLGFVLLFFHRQFTKLSEIADEIENSEELKDID